MPAVHGGLGGFDEQSSQAQGIRSVPYLLIDGVHGVSGSQTPDQYLSAILEIAARDGG
ncbi:hypothetical protein J5226_20220 [Lysobacter sp. K5869]|uniref:hypothetical protein n=1 Tax=Lysobacter sp. K5869 TaxID=2820808 RepID=UPI001C0610E8|nr:hypothetical protein [Lysobacter sp. K5869]QWP75907.1 hypothetical protein J5226_20220 [Lysobacter sp. K5869]